MERLGRFELVQHLATGGMADVYLARRFGLGGFDRQLAIKTLRGTDDTFIGMFLDEARLLSKLHHRHIVQTYEVDCDDDGNYFMVMEYVDGHTVRRVLQESVQRDMPLPLDFTLTIATSIAAALHHAHEHDVIHRDVSPSNVLVGRDGAVKLIDFGIAKSEDRATRTAVGFVKGKAGYMAPEQVRGYDVDHRADVFALGILAYELTTRRRAFPAGSVEEQLRMLTEASVAPPALMVDGYPRELERIVMMALEEQPEERHLDARSMQLALERFAMEHHITLGGEVVARVMRELFPQRPKTDLIEEDTVPYDLDVSFEDVLAGMATPTPVWTARPC
ncbi:MAG: serine/threonine protein kinase [Deltaproteobacteria bacterium]|nr:serine/threonine protein kinase [Deltaproteobacteria bacterium]